MSSQTTVVADVLAERDRQDAKWGEQNHEPAVYLAILVEEVGEAAEDVAEFSLGDRSASRLARLREELVQVAAVAVAMVEAIDRNRDHWT